ncbi:MAG: DHH family phosphoesterase [Tyzzerella sp.]|nr:DHH family phosphoesterase [Tyzzerella sp.]
MKNDVKLKGQLRLYMQWPAIMGILLLAMNIWIFMIDKKAGLIMGVFVLIYIVAVAFMYFHSKSMILTDLEDFTSQYGSLQNVFLKDLTIPYAIMMDDGRIIWFNDDFQKIFGEKKVVDKYLSNFIQDLNRSVFPKADGEKAVLEVTYEGKVFNAVLSRVSVKHLNDTERILGLPKGKEYFVTLTLEDVTELQRYILESEGQKLVSGLIYIDNYDEVMESVEEVRQSLLVALIDRKVNQYMAVYDGLVRKMEKDKYFFVVKKQCFKEMEKKKFSILEEAKNVNIGNTMPVTLSIGMGFSSETYAQSYQDARVAIDLALARGGDQAVIKHGKDITYYGGKREQTSKNTRVKARVKAEALREFIMSKDQVIVMGHRIADVDSFGAAVGIYRAAQTMQKKAHIVLNDITSSVRPFYEAFCESAQYPDDMFIKSADVHDYVTENSMVVVVDTNRPELTECPELLKMAKTIVVFDHHRQGKDNIENTVLSYIEPYASSACEMVAEMLQYFADHIRITNMEANSMYAGIMIDTNNFMNRTGVRTFEAAAFLRRNGADVTYVRKIFRDDLEWYREKSKIVSNAEIFLNEYAIAVCDNEELESPTIIGAQAANELLNIKGIKASFVLTEYYGKIYVSARAIDEVNVQIIMERLGGGGHINTAGTQFQHTNMEEAIKEIKNTINTMIVEGDI